MGLYQAFDSKNIVKQFYNALEASEELIWSRDIAFMNDGSDRAIEEYNWLGQVSPMRRWVGNRLETTFNKYSLTITNELWETTIPVDKNDERRDKTGQINMKIGDAAEKTNTNWNTLASELLNAAGGSTISLAYDGQYFFDSDHNESGTNQTNALTSTEIPGADVTTTSAPTPTEAANILNQALAYFESYTDDQGDPINGNYTTVTVLTSKPSIYSAFRIAANPTITLLNQSTNPVVGLPQKINVRYSPRLTAADSVRFLISNNGPYKPLIFQDEQGVEVQYLGEGSDEAFKNDRYLFGVRASRGRGYGAWQKAIQVTLS